MDIIPQIFTARVTHKRLFPKENSFTYGLYYLLLPLPAPIIPSNLVSFNRRDLGYRDGSDPKDFAKTILRTYGLEQQINHIMLVTMPSVLGYVFNPVSFYLCLDQEKDIRAVIAEVHNTFGEQHTYLCAHSDHTAITNDDWLEAEKLFHVSPFLERSGSYKFRFSLQKDKLGIWIDYFDKEKNKQLITSLIGNLQPLTRSSIQKAFLSYPLLTLKAIILIHWQALKLVAKNIRYVIKPKQYEEKVSATSNLKEYKKQKYK
jgi:DUF1365 family protein